MLTSSTPGSGVTRSLTRRGSNRWQVALEDDGLAELGGSLLDHADQVEELLETLHRWQENKDLALPVLDAEGAPRHLLGLDLLGLPPSSRCLAGRQRLQLVERRDLGLLGWLGPPGERSKGQAQPDRGVPGDQGEIAPAQCPAGRRPTRLFDLERSPAREAGHAPGTGCSGITHPTGPPLPSSSRAAIAARRASLVASGPSAGAMSMAGGSPPGRLASTWRRCSGSS